MNFSYVEIKRKAVSMLWGGMAAVMLSGTVLPGVSNAVQANNNPNANINSQRNNGNNGNSSDFNSRYFVNPNSVQEEVVTDWDMEYLMPFSIFENGKFVITEEGQESLSFAELSRLSLILEGSNQTLQHAIDYVQQNQMRRDGNQMLYYTIIEVEDGIIIQAFDATGRIPGLWSAIAIVSWGARVIFAANLPGIAGATFSLGGFLMVRQKKILSPLNSIGMAFSAFSSMQSAGALEMELRAPVVVSGPVTNRFRNAGVSNWILRRNTMPAHWR